LLQEAQLGYLRKADLTVDILCALVNNNAKCYDESLEFADHVNEVLDEKLKVGSQQLCVLQAGNRRTDRREDRGVGGRTDK
jgi:hypothetical protein